MKTLNPHPSLAPVVHGALNTCLHTRGVYTQAFAFFSANLYHCLPGIPLELHESLYRQACAHQALAVAEQKCPYQHQNLQKLPSPEAQLESTGIIVTYHAGSYRLIGRWLAVHGIPFTLVLSNAVANEQGDTYRQLVKESGLTGNEFTLLDAERPDALLGMRSALRKGHHLLVYVDGNTGASEGRNQIELPFLQGKLRVRTGVAYLAQLMQCPVYRVINQRMPGGECRFLLSPPLVVPRPQHGESRNEIILQAMKHLYEPLATLVSDTPQQWEGWFYLQHDLILPESAVAPPADDQAWVRFFHDGVHYRLHRKSFWCSPE